MNFRVRIVTESAWVSGYEGARTLRSKVSASAPIAVLNYAKHSERQRSVDV